MFETEQSRLESAAAVLEAERARLLRPDGSRLYSDQEHAEREAAAFARFNAVADAQQAAIDRAIEQAERTLMLSEYADPLDRLSGDELAQASTRAPFVKEDVEALDLPELADRLRAIHVQGDKVLGVLWLRYGGQRLAALVEAGRARPGGRGPGSIAEAETVAALLGQLAATVGDSQAAEKRQAAQATRHAAGAARRAFGKRRSELDGSIEWAMAEMRRSGRYSL